jgi:hypothetical protein
MKGLCGEVNGKNRMGGYVGYKPFLISSDGSLHILNSLTGEMATKISRAYKNPQGYAASAGSILSSIDSKKIALESGEIISAVMLVQLDSGRNKENISTDLYMISKMPEWSECQIF